ncbi:MAG: ADP-ribosyltransferase domain-containing protein, partial [Cyanobacteria bacterium P01_A01_bin.123]
TVESQTGAIQSKTMTESTMDGTPMQPQATIQRKGLYDLMMGRGSGKFVNSKYKSAQNDKPKQQTSKQAKEKIVDSKYKSAQNNKPKQQTSKPVEEEAKPDSSKTADKGQIVAIIKANPDADAKHLTFKVALKKLKKKKVQGSWVKLVLREMGGIAAPNHREKQIRAIMREKRKGDIPKEFTKFSEFKGTVQEQGQAFRQAEKAYIEGGSAGKDFRQRLLNGELDLRDIQSNSPELRNQVDPTIGIFHTPAEKMTTDLLSGSYKETYPQLAQADMKDLLSIAIYTRGTNNPKKAPYYIINELLRNLDPKTAYDDKFKNDDKSLGIYEPYIMGIASGINNLPPYKGRCFRGGGPPIDIRNKKYQPGKKVKEAGFTSASVAADVTTEFGGNTFYVIDAAGGGAYISPVSEKGDLEAEILFPHNSEFEVRSVYGFDSFKEALSCGHRFFQGTSASDLEQRKPDQIGKVYTGDEVSKAPVMLVHMKEIPTQKQAERANQYQEDNGASTDSYYDPILDIGKHNHLLGDSLQDDSRPPSTFGNEKSDEILALIEEYKAQILTQGITFDDDDDTDVDSNYDEDDMLTRARHNPATSRSGR